MCQQTEHERNHEEEEIMKRTFKLSWNDNNPIKIYIHLKTQVYNYWLNVWC